MSIFLDDYAHRPLTLALWLHNVRATLRHQGHVLMPTAAGLGFAAAAVLDVAPLIVAPGTDFLATLRAEAELAAVAGLPAALGAAALWAWVSARLYHYLDTHPLSQRLIARGYRMPARPTFEDPALILGEVHPERLYNGCGYTLQFTTDARYSVTPEWCVIPAKGAVTGVLCLGATGGGKTANFIRSSAFGLFAHPTRPAGLVMDAKAALIEPLTEALATCGRHEDLLRIGPRHPTRWNPFHAPEASPAVIADGIISVLENLNGSPYSSDAAWIKHGVSFLAQGIIGIIRTVSGYVTATTMRAVIETISTEIQGSDTPGKDTEKFINSIAESVELDEEQQDEIKHFRSLVVGIMSQDDKFRQVYISELQTLLIPLTTPGVSRMFNAPESELDMPPWPEFIRRGLVLALDCNTASVPGLSVIAGTLLKLGYQQAALARLEYVRDGLCDLDSYMILLIDEYQDFASPEDAKYLALCRESKSITIFATQGFDSVIQHVGEERAKVIIQSLRNRIIFTQSLPEFAAGLLGEREYVDINSSVAETQDSATLHATGRFAGKSSVQESLNIQRSRRHVIPPEELAALPMGTAIVQGHDGTRSMPLQRVFLTPYYAPNRRHADSPECLA